MENTRYYVSCFFSLSLVEGNVTIVFNNIIKIEEVKYFSSTHELLFGSWRGWHLSGETRFPLISFPYEGKLRSYRLSQKQQK